MGLFNFGKKESEIQVRADGASVMWKVNVDGTDFANTVKINVGEGSAAVVYKDGGFAQMYKRSDVIDWKNLVKKGGSVISIYGVDTGRSFDILFGFGGIVFHDTTIDDTTEVGIRGVCRFKVTDPKTLLLNMGTSNETITVEDIRKKFFSNLETASRSECTKIFENHGYRDVQGALLDLSNIVKKSVEGEMYQGGIMIESCKISDVHFPEDYTRKFQNKVDADKAHEEEKFDGNTKFMQDLQIIKELNNSKSESTNKSYVCAFCHFTNEAGSKFCNRCGKKLN